MLSTEARTRQEMVCYSTAYEIVADLPSGRMRLGFAERVSKGYLLRMARQHAAAILPFVSDDDAASYSARSGLRLGKNVVIRKSGRTERECAA